VEPLATIGDLADRGITHANSALLSSLLDAASAAVRDAAGVPISRGTWVVQLPGTPARWLALPGQPVTDVSHVELDEVELLVGVDCRLIGGRLYRSRGWQRGCEPSVVTVTMTAGLAEVPADIVDLVCAMVGSALRQVDEGYGTVHDRPSIRIDDYHEQQPMVDSQQRLAGPMELPPATRARLRARFGGGVAVVGSGR